MLTVQWFITGMLFVFALIAHFVHAVSNCFQGVLLWSAVALCDILHFVFRWFVSIWIAVGLQFDVKGPQSRF